MLSTISDKKTGNDSSGAVNYSISEVLSQNDYYPFGMLPPGRSYSAGTGYGYGFNRREQDIEVSGQGNQYDYGFRIYNPRLGKFLSVDPLQQKHPGESPFIFTGDNPVLFIDPDGRDRIITHFTTVEFADGNSLLMTKTTVEKGVYYI